MFNDGSAITQGELLSETPWLCLRQAILQQAFTVSNVHPKCYGCFVGPASSNISNCVTTTSQHQQRQVVFLDELDALPMTCLGGNTLNSNLHCVQNLGQCALAAHTVLKCNFTHLSARGWSSLDGPQTVSLLHTAGPAHWADMSPSLWSALAGISAHMPRHQFHLAVGNWQHSTCPCLHQCPGKRYFQPCNKSHGSLWMLFQNCHNFRTAGEDKTIICNSPSGHRFQGSILHTCGKTRS